MKKIHITMFGGLKDYFPQQFELTLNATSTGVNLIDHLISLQPESDKYLKVCQLAIQEAIFDKEQELPAGSEVVILPPFSGG